MKFRDVLPIWHAFSGRRQNLSLSATPIIQVLGRSPPRVIINTGSFVPYFGACAVIIESGRLEVPANNFQPMPICVGQKAEEFRSRVSFAREKTLNTAANLDRRIIPGLETARRKRFAL